ncbi:isoamylase early set domain-containing protein [Sphaerisporangium sp. TRM90804]|uniref:isoamylase early set domain-containing protein n=1 Tax=Sphaerisporangium sp. TRM90804 TaxID=3031113 RepID=UPI0024495A34|nr:isoamylase early set domain-containing protein [Sphaerisporangium sp. TRM90804]MDH2429493.1 isoamylase early set domain-containing protein [Sphaerisporangium sp. TRM90804]
MLKRNTLFGRKTRVTFALPLDHPYGVVSVVGDFNGWNPGRHELRRRRNGTRTVSVILPQGVHRFRYLATGGMWFDDDTADHIDHHGSLLHL